MVWTEFTGYGTAVFGNDAGAVAFVPAGADTAIAADLRIRASEGQLPRYEGATIGPREIQFLAVQKPLAGVIENGEVWQERLNGIFRPGAGMQLLTATHRSTSGAGTPVPVRLLAASRGITLRSPGLMEGVLVTESPFWEAVTAQVFTTSPVTLSPAGNYPAPAVLTLTPTTGTVRRVRATVLDRTGRGLWDTPVRIGPPDGGVLDTSGQGATAAANYAAFANQLPLPFILQTPDHATLTKWDVRVGVPAGATTVVDLFFGSAVNNVLAQGMNDAGLDLAHASHGNGTWIWRQTQGAIGGKIAFSMFQLGSNPRTTGAWLAAHLGTDQPGVSFGKTASAPLAFAVSTMGLPKDADGIVLVTGIEAADAGVNGALRGISALLSGTGAALRVAYLLADSTEWLPATLGALGYQGAGAVAWAIYLDPLLTTAAASLTIQANAADLPPRIVHDAGRYPSVALSAPNVARVLNGAVTNTDTGQTITFTNVYTDNVALTVNPDTGLVEPVSGDILYAGEGDGGITIGRVPDRYTWWEVDPLLGANHWTATGGLSVGLSVRPRYALA